ncbi:MAG: tubulin-like doman-containing protein [Gemmataceae bacterium]|nr:tubulin-like doman-containing protein [Gemmataceae bacterium]
MPIRLEKHIEPIPGYRLIERLGRGGFGEVWKAEAPGGLLKAIKFVYGDLSDTNDQGVAAEQELKALSRVKSIRHPFLLSLERYDIVDGQLIIVMELADRNLWDRFKECRAQGLPGIPRDELLGYMEEAAEALDLMNLQHQLQHLDIKPQNLFLVHNHIKVADFGLVKDLEGMKASVTGGVTPLYAAPETFDGWVSRYSDQYSLAIVYQELLTGVRPFSGTNARQLVLQHLQAIPDLSPLTPGDREAIGRALAKKPDERFPSCRDLVRSLRGRSAAAAVRPGVEIPSECKTPLRGSAAGRERSHLEEALPSVPTARPGGVLVGPDVGERQTLAGVAPTTTKDGRDGVLLPALVIGIGGMGLSLVRQVRETLAELFGSLGNLRHLRFLYVDTDAEATRRAADGSTEGALASHEIFLARLNRPSHYLKHHENRVEIESWLDTQLLYRMPRSQVTTGLRALGRLALVDHYPNLVPRLRQELQACFDRESIEEADRQTGLGVSSERPRVYVVAGLAGGTGSGMFLDMAYIVREQLGQLGRPETEIVGCLLLPPVGDHPGRSLGVSNTYAALMELSYFSTPGVVYSARYVGTQPPLRDPGPPFDRCVVLPMPSGTTDATEADKLGAAAGMLVRELGSPLGRRADMARRSWSHATARPGSRREQAPSPDQLLMTTVGSYRWLWPRSQLIQRAAQLLGQQLVDHWTSKEVGTLRSAVQTWVAEQWAKAQLGPESVIDQLESACERALGEMPESAFAALTDRLAPRDPNSPGVTAAAVADVVKELEQLVGRPDDDHQGLQGIRLVDTLDSATRELTAGYEQRLAELAVSLVEQPQYRLAGAEEAIRQLTTSLEQVVAQQERLLERATKEAAEAHSRLRGLLEQLQQVEATREESGPSSRVQALLPGWQPSAGAARRRATLAADLVAAVRHYPRVRFRALIHERTVSVYRALLGNCPEYLRELGFCRVRLKELSQLLSENAPPAPFEASLGPGRTVFTANCRSLEEAAGRARSHITQHELLEFDHLVQAVIRRTFKALVHVCMGSPHVFKDLARAIRQQGEKFMEARLGKTDVLQLFLEQFGSETRAAGELTDVYHHAAPILPTLSEPETALLAVPRTGALEAFRALAGRVLPQVEVVPTNEVREIVCYREQRVSLADLPQLGEEARQIYEHMRKVEHFTPHSRMDIADWSSAAVPPAS